MTQAITIMKNANGIVHLVIDVPDEKLNILKASVFEELEQQLDSLAKSSDVKLLAISSGKPDSFIAGADIHEFDASLDRPQDVEKIIQRGQRVFRKIAELPFPTAAMINGICVGGGLELALSCTYRIVSDHPKTSLGLPEVTLGIIPAWGGTQRLPRVIGLTGALEMIVTGRPVNAMKAWKMKLADAIVPWEFWKEKTEEFLSNCIKPESAKKIIERRRQHGLRHFLLEGNPIGRYLVFRKAEKDIIQKTKGKYPAPLVALKVLRETYGLPLAEGLKKETAIFHDNSKKLFPVAKHLIPLFFIQENIKKNPGGSAGVEAKTIEKAGVLGAGTMGATIAWLTSNNGIATRIKDINWEAIGKGLGVIKSSYDRLVNTKKLKTGEANIKFHKVSYTIDYRGFKGADLIIEAAVENLDLKRIIFKEIEAATKPDCIIASNTSSLTIEEMSKEMQHPERFLGMHFFNPADRMPLVEIVPGKKTTPEAVATAIAFCKKLNKVPLVVADCPGFLVNRIFVLGANETIWMLQEGEGFEHLEKAMLDFGMPMSPFLLGDEVGNDVAYKVAQTFEKAYGPRMAPPELLGKMVEHNLYGKKSGKGFYIYHGNKKTINPELLPLLKPASYNNHPLSNEQMVERVLFVMVNEAARCLQEKVVQDASRIDMAMIMGTGFPPFRGGLLRYADEKGISYIVDELRRLEQKHGVRFTPCELLIEMQQNGKTFYGK